jgi:hypothetical protein
VTLIIIRASQTIPLAVFMTTWKRIAEIRFLAGALIFLFAITAIPGSETHPAGTRSEAAGA